VTPLLVGVDQEGGRVVRLPPPFLTPPPAAVLGAIDDPDLTRTVARAMGQELRAAGFNWNLAPVLDVHTNPRNPIIGDRAFSHDPDRVARMGLAVFRGFDEVGILATAKHFPGHGETAADSHLTLPESLQTAARWRLVEFAPFRAAIQAGIPSILVAHMVCPALDPETASSLSRIVTTDILRTELGFNGVVVSDDLEMGAIAATCNIGEAAVRFLEAGGDLVLICRNADRQREALDAVEIALQSGRLPATRLRASLDRLTRFTSLLASHPDAPSLDAARAIIGHADHRALLAAVATAAARLGDQPRATEA
jgi:beta-N-acetylhexosaminidase